MKYIVQGIIAAFSLFLLVGCSVDHQRTSAKPEQLEVTIDSDKKQLKVNEPVKVTAKVKYGNKEISKEDSKVEFEIIENGVSVGSVTPDYEGKGKYTLKTMFLEEGSHQVVAHVDYKEFHEMPILSLHLSK